MRLQASAHLLSPARAHAGFVASSGFLALLSWTLLRDHKDKQAMR